MSLAGDAFTRLTGKKVTSGQKIDRLKTRAKDAEAKLAATETKIQEIKSRWVPGYIHLSDPSLALRRLRELTNTLVPCTASEFKKMRLGSPHDGGYVCLDDFTVDGALSLGIGRNVDWDFDAANLGLTVHQYDHTVDGPPRWHKNFVFHKQKIGGDGLSLEEVTKAAGWTKSANCILKMDIEWAEWDLLSRTQSDVLNCFSQIAAEFHGFNQILEDEWFELALATFRRLSPNFQLIHAHGNNYGEKVIIGNIVFPRCIELTFVNTNRYKTVSSAEEFPGPLDGTNNPELPEIFLSNLRY